MNIFFEIAIAAFAVGSIFLLFIIFGCCQCASCADAAMDEWPHRAPDVADEDIGRTVPITLKSLFPSPLPGHSTTGQTALPGDAGSKSVTQKQQ